jgi:hypothetical protein
LARERWFYAHADARHGPLPLPELVDALIALPDPQTSLVWTRGLEAWTRAGRVERLAQQLRREIPEAVVPKPPAPRQAPVTRSPPLPPAAAAAATRALPRPALYAGGALLVAVAVAAVVLGLRGGGEPTAGATAAPPGGTATAGAGTSGPISAASGGGNSAMMGWAETETDVPAQEIGLLKGVAAWQADELTVTLYNGSRWRVTEILVRTSVLEGDQFVDSALLHPLVPKQEVDANVAPILEQVAPQRRRPALNPDDTRAFAGKAGQKPRAYRWRIEAARGFAPAIQR